MSTLRNVPVEEAQAAVTKHAHWGGNWVGRLAGVPTVPNMRDHGDLNQWVTVGAAMANIAASTTRYWVPDGLAVHTEVTIMPGVTVDAAFLYLFEPPDGYFDLEDGSDR